MSEERPGRIGCCLVLFFFVGLISIMCPLYPHRMPSFCYIPTYIYHYIYIIIYIYISCSVYIYVYTSLYIHNDTNISWSIYTSLYIYIHTYVSHISSAIFYVLHVDIFPIDTPNARRLDLNEFVTQIQAFRRTNSVTIKASPFMVVQWWYQWISCWFSLGFTGISRWLLGIEEPHIGITPNVPPGNLLLFRPWPI